MAVILSGERIARRAGGEFPIADWLGRVSRRDALGTKLDAQAAGWLASALLGGRIGDIERGAVLHAWRSKGESAEELHGALQAADAFMTRVPCDPGRPLVVIPSYPESGNRPDSTPLTACLLADAGVSVLVHGERTGTQPGACAEMFGALGIPICTSLDDAPLVMSRGDPAFVALDLISPALDTLCALRWRLGTPNIGHAIAGLLEPSQQGRALLLILHADAASRARCREVISLGGRRALLAPEPVSRERHAPVLPGVFDERAQSPVFPPGSRGVSACANWIQSVLAGERPVPVGVESRVRQVLAALGKPRRSDPLDTPVDA